MNTDYTRSEIREIAKYHKFLLISILIVIVTILAVLFIGNNLLVTIVAFGNSGFQIFVLYKLAKSLKLSTVQIIFLAILLLFGSFVGIVSLLVLLFIHNKAMKALKEAGIKVGLLGADTNSIE